MEKLIGELDFTVLTTQLNVDGSLKISSILDMFQTAAGIHATNIGLGREKLLGRNLIWILVRSDLKIINNKTNILKTKVVTWPHSPKLLQSIRDYELYDETGDLIAIGTSSWCLFDINKNFITKFPNDLFKGEMIDKRTFEEDIKKRLLIKVDNEDKIYEFVVPYSLYDANEHVNNAKYADFILNAFGGNVNIKSFYIDYIKQLHKGDFVTLYKKKVDDDNYYFVGYSDETVIFTSYVEIGNEHFD